MKNSIFGIDGCKKGWVVASLKDNQINVSYTPLNKLVFTKKSYLVIDIPIFLPNCSQDYPRKDEIKANLFRVYQNLYFIKDEYNVEDPEVHNIWNEYSIFSRTFNWHKVPISHFGKELLKFFILDQIKYRNKTSDSIYGKRLYESQFEKWEKNNPEKIGRAHV